MSLKRLESVIVDDSDREDFSRLRNYSPLNGYFLPRCRPVYQFLYASKEVCMRGWPVRRSATVFCQICKDRTAQRMMLTCLSSRYSLIAVINLLRIALSNSLKHGSVFFLFFPFFVSGFSHRDLFFCSSLFI